MQINKLKHYRSDQMKRKFKQKRIKELEIRDIFGFQKPANNSGEIEELTRRLKRYTFLTKNQEGGEPFGSTTAKERKQCKYQHHRPV